MSRAVKWILGILAVLVVVAVVAGAAWFWQHRGAMMLARPNLQQGVPGNPNGQGLPNNGPRGFDNDGRGPMMRGWGFRGPMMRGRGFGMFGMGMFFLGGMLRLFFPLALLALVAFIFYQLGRRSRTTVVRQDMAAVEPPRSNADVPRNE